MVIVACALASSLSAQVSGTVFQDFNADGTQQNSSSNTEPGLAGVVINAYNPSGATLAVTYTGGGTATNGTGGYSVPTATPGQVRLEFVLPDAYTFASKGSVGGTTVLFPTAATGQNLAVNYPGYYCQNTPNMVTPCYVNGRPPITASYDAAIVRYPYTASGTTENVNNTYLAEAAQLGSTWGIAYDRTNQHIYTSAFVKRHVGLKDNDSDGKEDIGAIYRMTTSGSPVLWLDLATLGVDVGLSVMPTIAARGLPNNNIQESHDPDVFPLVGKVGLGDIDISDDNKQLFIVNLYDKKVYTLDIATQTLVGSGISIPSSCSGGELRPFGLKYYKGKLYVGAVCDAISSQSSADLTATVYRLDAGVFTSVLSFPLNYPKGAAFNDGTSKFGTQWNPWRDVFYPMLGFHFNGQNNPCLPQPMLVNIEFDVNGDMIMVFNDRLGHQTGTLNWGTDPNDNSNYYSSVSGGDLLRASWNGSTYTLENNGTVGGLSGAPGNNEGPGGGEFYYNDRSLSGGSFYYHEENVTGGGTFLAGTREFAVHVADPINAWSAGTFWISNTNGAFNDSYEIFPTTYNVLLFGKANGLGDLELTCNNQPLEIGNRVWMDADDDGIQDAGEMGVAGVTVKLYQGATQVGQTTTAADGSYYFTSSNVNLNGAAGLLPQTAYTIRIDAANFPAGKVLSSKSHIGGSGQPDVRDNDASLVSGNAEVPVTTGGYGENDHRYDIAFTVYTCTAPSAISFNQTPPTCTGTTPNNNGTISLTAVTNGTHYGVSTLGAGTYDGPTTVAGATAIPGTLPAVVKSAVPNTGGTYIIRVFNGADDCYTDQTVTVLAVNCSGCPGGLLSNWSFEDGTFTNYTQSPVPGWNGPATAGQNDPAGPNPFVIPNGLAIGYSSATVNVPVYQQVAATPGNSYTLTFYAGMHDPVQNDGLVTLQYYDAGNAPIGTAQQHDVTYWLESTWPNPSFGGPYTLNVGAAPANAAFVRVSFFVTALNTAWDAVKVDAMCLTVACTAPSGITFTQAPPTCTGTTPNNNGAISLATATNGTHYGVSTLGAGTYDGPTTIAGATVIPGTLPAVVKSAVPNTGGTYIIRVFNGADDCYTDQTVTVNPVNCNCPSIPCGATTVVKN